ncbi:MAG: PLP-dependent aminotransferase family protein [Candidatus Zixiibacteriota bacterium]
MFEAWSPEIQKADLPVYLAILGALERDIVSGSLQPGQRLPTHRELADHLKLAIGTVTKAYLEAERRGLIRGDGRRGTFVAGHKHQPKSPTLSIESEPGLIDLSPYYPPADTDPDLRHALAELSNREINYLMHYTGPKGYARHREIGAQWVSTLGLKVGEEDVIVTAGAQHAILVTLMALTDRGDTIATARHTYTGVKWVAELLGLRLVGIEADRDGLLPDAFDSCCRKHNVKFLYCIPSLDNPTNAILSESRRHTIAGVAEKYGVEIIEDEINRRLLEQPYPLISSMAPGRTYLIASLAKVVAGGLRICYLVAPQSNREKLYKAVLGSTLMVSPLAAELASLWISDGTAERSVLRKRAEAKKRSAIAADILGDLEYYGHPSSYFVWLKLPARWHTGEFAAETHRTGVVVAPADIFAVDPHDMDNAVRLCLGGKNTIEDLERGLRLISAIIHGTAGPKSTVF